MKTSELIIRCLEAEGVSYLFGIPGEENIDLLSALGPDSQTRFILTRDERGAAFMAQMTGRLTGRPGVCLSTLGPGATNLVTGIANAFLDFSPLVALTAQTGTRHLYKESHQAIDLISMFRPITKWNTSLREPSETPGIIRKAFRVAAAEKPGPVQIEIPEDLLTAITGGEPIQPMQPAEPVPPEEAVSLAAAAIRAAQQPIILAGNGVIRAGAVKELSAFSRKLRIPVTTTFMGMGAFPADDELFISTVGLQSRDYISCGFERADLIIAVGYDPVEFSPEYWGGDKKVVHIHAAAPEAGRTYNPLEVTGDIRAALKLLGAAVDGEKDPSYFMRLRGFAETVTGCSLHGFPLKPLRIIKEIRKALGRDDILVSDVGAHKIWIGRFYPAFRENTALISNGLASMGVAVPSAIAAKLLFPERKVVAAVGDGGLLMSFGEIETAIRLGLSFVCLVFNDSGLGLIGWKERLKYREEFFVRFRNPDFVALAASFGARGYRVTAEDELGPILADALRQEVPAIIDCPVDYRENLVLSERLGSLICPV